MWFCSVLHVNHASVISRMAAVEVATSCASTRTTAYALRLRLRCAATVLDRAVTDPMDLQRAVRGMRVGFIFCKSVAIGRAEHGEVKQVAHRGAAAVQTMRRA